MYTIGEVIEFHTHLKPAGIAPDTFKILFGRLRTFKPMHRCAQTGIEITFILLKRSLSPLRGHLRPRLLNDVRQTARQTGAKRLSIAACHLMHVTDALLQ